MKIAVFSTEPYDRQFLEAANSTYSNELTFLEPRLAEETASLAAGYPAVCVFVNDRLGAKVLEQLARQGTRLIALRSAGFNNVDLNAAKELGLTVVRVAAYSPYAVAEHTVGLMLTLNRKIHRAYARVHDGNFALNGLMGFDMHGKTVGIVGVGRIGIIVAGIMKGFGCNVIAFDASPGPECAQIGVRCVELPDLFASSDIVTLHCPLKPETHHLINAAAIEKMKKGVMLINTSRGGLVDTQAVIAALKSGRIAHLGLNVYEEEADLFFRDLSEEVLQDDVFARLLTFHNVVITAHQAFFTREALEKIADTTFSNIAEFEKGLLCQNVVTADCIV